MNKMGIRDYQKYLSELRKSMPFSIKCSSVIEASRNSKILYKEHNLLSRAIGDEVRFVDEETFLAAIIIL